MTLWAAHPHQTSNARKIRVQEALPVVQSIGTSVAQDPRAKTIEDIPWRSVRRIAFARDAGNPLVDHQTSVQCRRTSNDAG